MPFVLKKDAKDYAETFQIHHYESQPVDDLEDPEFKGKEIETITVTIRPLTGRDIEKLTNSMMRGTRKGETQFKAGTSGKKKVILATIALDGMVDEEGNAVTEMTEAVYDRCPGWITDRILQRVQEISGEVPGDDEGES